MHSVDGQYLKGTKTKNNDPMHDLRTRYKKCLSLTKAMFENELDDLGYESRGGRYRIQLKQGDTKKYNEVLLTLFKMADKYRNE